MHWDSNWMLCWFTKWSEKKQTWQLLRLYSNCPSLLQLCRHCLWNHYLNLTRTEYIFRQSQSFLKGSIQVKIIFVIGILTIVGLLNANVFQSLTLLKTCFYLKKQSFLTVDYIFFSTNNTTTTANTKIHRKSGTMRCQ